MKQFLFISVSLLFLFNSCSKKSGTILPPQENAFVQAIFTYLNTHLPQEELEQLTPEQYTRLQRDNTDQLLLIPYRQPSLARPGKYVVQYSFINQTYCIHHNVNTAAKHE